MKPIIASLLFSMCGGPSPSPPPAVDVEKALDGTAENGHITVLLATAAHTLQDLFDKPSLAAPAEVAPGANGREPGTSDVTTGNALSVIVDGDNYRATLLAEIRAASASIWINVFELQADASAAEVVDAVVAAAGRGVSVRMVVDNRHTLADFEASPVATDPLVQRLRAAGCDVRAVTYDGIRVNHRKLMIFDGNIAMVMGGNIGGSYLLPLSAGWTYHDAGIHLSGPAVADVAAVFVESYRRAGGADLPLPAVAPAQVGSFDDAHVQIVWHDAGGDRNIERELVQRIDAASRRIVLANGFGMSSDIRSALLAARGRGVAVTWLWGLAAHAPALMAQAHFSDLRAAGVDVRRYAHPLHMKAYLVDDTLLIGSANLDGFSGWLNDEVALQITSPELAAAFDRAVLRPDFDGSPALTGDAVAASSLEDKLTQTVLEAIID